MRKDKRTKAELLDALDAALGFQEKAAAAVATMEHELRKAKAGKDAAETTAANLKQAFERIRHTIRTAVALRHPKTVAFGGVETVWYEGQMIHPGYEGDSEEVRLLQLINEQCLEALA